MITSAQTSHARAPRVLSVATLSALLAVSVGLETGAAQATLIGRVIDSEMGHPLPSAQVKIRPSVPNVVTDSLGQFQASQLPPGDAEVTIELPGYAPGIFLVRLPASGVVEKVFAMDFTGHRLPEQLVRARAEKLMARYLDFERRRQRKQGAFLRWDDLEKQGVSSVGDALRTVRGVRMQCNQQTFECFAVMSRAPRCKPVWWIDGVEVGSFHENTPIRDVYGIEIYRGPGEIPGEYSGSNAACGVIVLWTKSRPFR